MLNDRQQRIVELLTSQGEVKVTELKEKYAVTEMTIRRDLGLLEKKGIVRRIFGGAIFLGQDVALRERSGINVEEKKKIGKKAASFIKSGESVFIDSGTTTLQVALHIQPNQEITVVTNALNIAEKTIEKKIKTIVIGGMVRESTSSMYGPMVIEALNKMAFDRVFLGATGVSTMYGFSNSNIDEAELKRVAISRTNEANIVIDSTKLGKSSLFQFAEFNQVHRVILDSITDDNIARSFLEKGIEIISCN